MKLYELYEGKKLKIAEKIQQRRRQMLVHSYIYYELDQNIVSDAKWSAWAKELAELQNRYPNMSKKIPYAEQFADWDGSSGAFLEYDDSIIDTAWRLLCLQTSEKGKAQVKIKAKKQSKKSGRRRLF